MPHAPLLVEKKREALKRALITMGGQVEVALRRSLDALRGQDHDLAREIIAGDMAINRERRRLEAEALQVLAAYKPAGADLRTVGATMELVAELERIGDYAADVARILLRHVDPSLPVALLERIADLGMAALDMLHDAMLAYEQACGDPALALAVAGRDDQVDALHRELIDAIAAMILDDPRQAARGIALSWIAHLYERVADRATNVAERVVYIATGETLDLD